MRFVERGVGGLQAIDGAGAAGRVQGFCQRLVFGNGLRHGLAGGVEQVLPIVKHQRVDGAWYAVDLAVVGAHLHSGVGEVAQVEFVLVLGPQVVQRAQPAVLRIGGNCRIDDVDDIERLGLRAHRDGHQFAHLVERHQLRVDFDAGNGGLHLVGPELERRIAVADQLHRVGREGPANRQNSARAEHRRGGGSALDQGAASGIVHAHGCLRWCAARLTRVPGAAAGRHRVLRPAVSGDFFPGAGSNSKRSRAGGQTTNFEAPG